MWTLLVIENAWAYIKHAQKLLDITVGNKAFKNGVDDQGNQGGAQGEQQQTRKQLDAGKKARQREKRQTTDGAAAEGGAKGDVAQGAEGERSEIGFYRGRKLEEMLPGSQSKECKHLAAGRECWRGDKCMFKHPGREAQQKQEAAVMTSKNNEADVAAETGFKGLKSPTVKKNMALVLTKQESKAPDVKVELEEPNKLLDCAVITTVLNWVLIQSKGGSYYATYPWEAGYQPMCGRVLPCAAVHFWLCQLMRAVTTVSFVALDHCESMWDGPEYSFWTRELTRYVQARFEAGAEVTPPKQGAKVQAADKYAYMVDEVELPEVQYLASGDEVQELATGNSLRRPKGSRGQHGTRQRALGSYKPGKSEQECRRLKTGKCGRGSMCSYRHAGQEAQQLSSAKKLASAEQNRWFSTAKFNGTLLRTLLPGSLRQPCTKYQNGYCAQADSCPFQHPGRNSNQSTARWAEEERREQTRRRDEAYRAMVDEQENIERASTR